MRALRIAALWCALPVLAFLPLTLRAQATPCVSQPLLEPVRLTDTTASAERDVSHKAGACRGIATLVRLPAGLRFRVQFPPCTAGEPWRTGADYTTMASAMRAAARLPACPPVIVPPPPPIDTTPVPPPPPPIDTTPVPPVPGTAWLESFSGQPTTPTPFVSNRWDIQRYSRDREVWVTPDAMPADHGAMDCAGPPATHTMASYAGMVFLCRDHMMTALKGIGYGAVILTPNAMLDWSSGPATLSFALSTLRRTRRDWMSFYLTPWSDALVIPTIDDAPGLNAQPRNGVWVLHTASGNLCASVLQNFGATRLPCTEPSDIEARFAARGSSTSASRRDTVTITISRTHLRVTWGGLPMVDADFPAPLAFTQAVVQLGHYSYNPDKECGVSPIAGNGACTANTWHWDDVRLSNAVPFTIIGSSPRSIVMADGAVTLNAPAPANATLRFHSIGTEPDISFTNGATWVRPTRLAVNKTNDPDMQYSTPIPAGTTRVLFRRARALVPWWNVNEMLVHDVHVWAR
jgi:hypothetical protein